eukprot:10168305-Alexandrium_andersonii.AAC.1
MAVLQASERWKERVKQELTVLRRASSKVEALPPALGYQALGGSYHPSPQKVDGHREGRRT